MKPTTVRETGPAPSNQLKETERDKIREALLAEKQRLLHNAQEGLSFAMNRERNIGRDSIDESMEEELFSTELRLRDREKYLLGKILDAIERLNNGTINECEDCGEPIGFKRLLARPVTTLCIDCKEEREREEQAQSQLGRAGSLGDSDFGMGEESGGEE
jgi:DnaK suppressor protein